MKLLLNAAGVNAIIQHDPEGTVELAKAAASQVADQLIGKVIEQRVNARLANVLDGLVSDPSSYKKVLSAAANNLIQEAVKAKVATLVDMKVGSVQHDEMRSTIRAMVKDAEKEMLAGLEGKIDALIRTRFAAAFGEK